MRQPDNVPLFLTYLLASLSPHASNIKEYAFLCMYIHLQFRLGFQSKCYKMVAHPGWSFPERNKLQNTRAYSVSWYIRKLINILSQTVFGPLASLRTGTLLGAEWSLTSRRKTVVFTAGTLMSSSLRAHRVVVHPTLVVFDRSLTLPEASSFSSFSSSTTTTTIPQLRLSSSPTNIITLITLSSQ